MEGLCRARCLNFVTNALLLLLHYHKLYMVGAKLTTLCVFTVLSPINNHVPASQMSGKFMEYLCSVLLDLKFASTTTPTQERRLAEDAGAMATVLLSIQLTATGSMHIRRIRKIETDM